MNPAAFLRPALLALAFFALPVVAVAQDDTTTPVTPAAPELSWRADASFNYSRGDYGVPRIHKKELTVPEDVHFATDDPYRTGIHG